MRTLPQYRRYLLETIAPPLKYAPKGHIEMSKESILEQFSLFRIGEAGIGAWLTDETDEIVFDRLDGIAGDSLSRAQLNQLFALSHEAPVSKDFFEYYWLQCPQNHPYSLTALRGFDVAWVKAGSITSLDHLHWGLQRLYVDGLLYFGNVRTAFRKLRSMNAFDLSNFFEQRRLNVDQMRTRGPALPLGKIARDDRYLISEMACKSYGEDQTTGDLRAALLTAFRNHVRAGGGKVAISDLLKSALLGVEYQARQAEFMFSADDVLNESVESESDLLQKYSGVADRFVNAREIARTNSRFYLSMVGDLDVYVATSMRNREDFRKVAADCETIFASNRLDGLNVRYFDPTLSAAAGHEDKGIIECLMVKSAKALVLCAGEKDSFGKDAEAAMALSQGKPVIFYCDHKARSRFYRDVHPLSRLIEFDTGIVVGAIVTDSLAEVAEILARTFTNTMEYEIDRSGSGNLRLLEKLTKSVVRLQTTDQLLAETFWNHYHNRRNGSAKA